MSRQMKREEIAAFEAKYGYKPTEIKVALDAVAFFVNKNNPDVYKRQRCRRPKGALQIICGV